MLTTPAYAGLNAQSLAREKPKDRAQRPHPPAANSVRSPRSRGRACKAGRRDDLEFATQRPRAAPDLSVVERRDRVAFADGPAELDSAIEPGAVEQRGKDRPCQQLLEVLAGKVQPSTAQHRLADLEALADELIERHAERREIAAMFCGRNLNFLAWKRRIAAGDRVEHFHFDERHLAHVGVLRVGADAIEIPVAFDPATPRPRTTRAYSAACRDGGRTLASPSASVAEMVVRTISRASCAGHGRPRCMVA